MHGTVARTKPANGIPVVNALVEKGMRKRTATANLITVFICTLLHKTNKMSDIIVLNMRFRIILALVVSIFLIGIASWFRFEARNNNPTNLQVISAQYEEVEKLPSLNIKTATTTTSGEANTYTDLLARQLTSSYINLLNTGQATDDNINSLAQFYVDHITDLVTNEEIGLDDIRVTSNSKETLNIYANSFVEIYLKYEDLVQKEIDSGGDNLITFNSTQSEITKNISNLYRERAKTMIAIPTPTSLSDIHIKLINNYLADATYFKLISEAENDPALAFAAIASQPQIEVSNEKLISDMAARIESYGS